MTELSICFQSNEKEDDSEIAVAFFRPGARVSAPPLDDKILTNIYWSLDDLSY